MRKILIIGKSGSGKSRAANALALRTKYPTYVVNDNNNKNSEDDKVFPDIDWEELPRLKNANVIVEDLISCTNQQLESLKVLCNWSAHHR
jgi:adenylate kinase family enzyme